YSNYNLLGAVTLAGSIVADNTSTSAVTIDGTNALTLGNITAGTSGSRGGLVLGSDAWYNYYYGGYQYQQINGTITQTSGTNIMVGQLSIQQDSTAGVTTLTNPNNEIQSLGTIYRGGALSVYDNNSGLSLLGRIDQGATGSDIRLQTVGALNLGQNDLRGNNIILAAGAAITVTNSNGSRYANSGNLVYISNNNNITLTGYDYASGSVLYRNAATVQVGATEGNTIELGSPATAATIAGIQLANTPTLNLVGGNLNFTTAPRRVAVTSTGDDHLETFTVTGTDILGRAQSEIITGSNAGTSSGTNYFATISSVTTAGTKSAGNVTVGTVKENITGNVTSTGYVNQTTVKGVVDGSTTLTNTNNAFANLNDFTAGGTLELYSMSNPLTVNGTVVSSGGDVKITTYYGLSVSSAGSITTNYSAGAVNLMLNQSAYGSSTIAGPLSAYSGGITITSARGAITTTGLGTLTANSTGGVNLTANNSYIPSSYGFITVGAGVTAGSAGITISSGGSFSNSTTGILNSAGAVALKAGLSNSGNTGYGITLAGNVTAGSSGVALASGDTIIQSAGILSSTGAVYGLNQSGSNTPTYSSPSAWGAITLGGNNTVGSLGPFYLYNTGSAAFNFNDTTAGLMLAGKIETSHGNVTIATAGAALDLATYGVYAGELTTAGANVDLTGRGIIQSGGTISATGGSVATPGTPANGTDGGTIMLTGYDGTASGTISLAGTLQTLKTSTTAITIRGTSDLALPSISASNGTLILGTATANVGPITGNITQSNSTSLDIKSLNVTSTGSAVIANSGNKIGTLGTISVGNNSGDMQYDLDINDSTNGLILSADVVSGGGIRIRTTDATGSGILALEGYNVYGKSDIFLGGKAVTQFSASTINADYNNGGATGGSIRIDGGGSTNNITLNGTVTTDNSSSTAIQIVNATDAVLNVVSATAGTVALGIPALTDGVGTLAKPITGNVSQVATTGTIYAATLAGNAGSVAITKSNIDNLGVFTTTGTLTLKDQGGTGTAGLKFTGDVTVGGTTDIETTDGILDLYQYDLNATGQAITLKGVGVSQVATTSQINATTADIYGSTGNIDLFSTLNDFFGQVTVRSSAGAGSYAKVRDANQLNMNKLNDKIAVTTSITLWAGLDLVLTPESITTTTGNIEFKSSHGDLTTPGDIQTGAGTV
ncbi:MAG: hypothetical protein WCI27_10270, partial [Candidatus Omnitrophota bacterium]